MVKEKIVEEKKKEEKKLWREFKIGYILSAVIYMLNAHMNVNSPVNLVWIMFNGRAAYYMNSFSEALALGLVGGFVFVAIEWVKSH